MKEQKYICEGWHWDEDRFMAISKKIEVDIEDGKMHFSSTNERWVISVPFEVVDFVINEYKKMMKMKAFI